MYTIEQICEVIQQEIDWCEKAMKINPSSTSEEENERENFLRGVKQVLNIFKGLEDSDLE